MVERKRKRKHSKHHYDKIGYLYNREGDRGADGLSDAEKDEKTFEKAMLLRRVFSRTDLFNIGKQLKIPYFKDVANEWKIGNEEEASLFIAQELEDYALRNVFNEFKPRNWAVFRGRFYSFEDGIFYTGSASKTVENGIRRAKTRYGPLAVSILKILTENRGPLSFEELKTQLKANELREALDELEKSKVIATSYKGDIYQEWQIPDETVPVVEYELGMKKKPPPKPVTTFAERAPRIVFREEPRVANYLLDEMGKVGEMDREFDEYLENVLKRRLDRTIKFGKEFNLEHLSSYLHNLFGKVLYFDSLLSITQQYGLANIEIAHEHGGTGKRTGWSLALFGDPGTGKRFSTRDMILGSPRAKIGAHGIPGRNRYCGGITPASFIRIGQAYSGKVYNFIVPEFNDFFRYKGMVEPLKIAMEQGEIKYETHVEVVGPYRFSSFFSVNYNVEIHDRGYEVTIQDPNFNAIEDRMLCRLHRLTKERFIELTKSQMKLALGAIDIEKDAQKIRDHLTLVYAIETGHPLVKDRFRFKPVMITPQVFDVISRARAAILERIPKRVVKFSARLEDKALRFAGAATLMEYFGSDGDFVPVSDEALRYATQLYVEEASVRSEETFEPKEVLEEVFRDTP